MRIRTFVATLGSVDLLPLSLALLLLVPLRTAAQGGVNHPFSMGLGLGYGSATVACSECGTVMGGPSPTRQEWGSAASLYLVGRVSPVVGLGLEANAWTKFDLFLWNLSLAAYYYVEPGSRFFLKGRRRACAIPSWWGDDTQQCGVGVHGRSRIPARPSRPSSIGPVATFRYGFVGSFDELTAPILAPSSCWTSDLWSDSGGTERELAQSDGMLSRIKEIKSYGVPLPNNRMEPSGAIVLKEAGRLCPGGPTYVHSRRAVGQSPAAHARAVRPPHPSMEPPSTAEVKLHPGLCAPTSARSVGAPSLHHHNRVDAEPPSSRRCHDGMCSGHGSMCKIMNIEA